LLAQMETHGVNTGPVLTTKDILSTVLDCLDNNKATEITTIDLKGKTSIADYLVIANGGSQRHVAALADYVHKGLKAAGMKSIAIEGLEQADWVLIDAGDVIVHIFRPEVRQFYNLDKMWGTDLESSDAIN